jgi:hypothetical protein
VQVQHDEGAANRIDPESCADALEGIGEALTGERIGQPLRRPKPTPHSRLSTSSSCSDRLSSGSVVTGLGQSAVEGPQAVYEVSGICSRPT